ncbi:MAG TPA: type VI secretion system tube protein Hcp [Thermoanaerobaculia bacterium]|nr:type VI secretion system tube protein Hcp [Thermoanaerobaculia bacterium]
MSLARRVSLLTALFCAVVAVSAGAATNMYIKFEGPGIAGGSTADGREKQIEVLSWSHGFVQPTSPTRSTAGAGTIEQATHQNLTFTKYLDSASNSIMKFCWSGKQFAKVTLTCYRADGESSNKNVAYLTVEMQHVVISNYSVSGGPGDIPVENVALDYGIVHYTYKDQKSAGGKDIPQSMTATPALRSSGATPSCSMKLPGASGALPVESWSLAKGSGFTFKTRPSTTATAAVAASRKLTAGGSATLTCGSLASITLTDAKISNVSNASDAESVTLSYGSIE